MNNYCVYMHISPSGKRYIGITKQKPKYRWGRGSGYRTNQYFMRAIAKYGWDSFSHIIIKSNLSYKDAALLERKLIAKYQSDNEMYGYNHSKGGEIPFAREKQDLHYGKSPKAKKVVQYTKDGQYMNSWESTTKAADILNIDYTGIVKCCKKQTKYAYGYIWFYEGEDTEESVQEMVLRNKNRYSVPYTDDHKAKISKGVKEHFKIRRNK